MKHYKDNIEYYTLMHATKVTQNKFMCVLVNVLDIQVCSKYMHLKTDLDALYACNSNEKADTELG